MKTKNVNKKIATLILRAQNASNGGKRNRFNDCRTYVGLNKSDNHCGYYRKEMLVYQAINLIIQNRKQSDFIFSVVENDESWARFIVYFQVKINDEVLQVSFHSPLDLSKLVNKNYQLEWDRGDSQWSAIRIYEYYNPNGEYLCR